MESPQDTLSYNFFPVASIEDIKIGERLFLEIDGSPVVIFNIAGLLYAIADSCTHDGGPLGDGDLEDHEIACPRHGARFDIRNGKALTLPAVTNIAIFPVRIVGDFLELGIPKKNQ